MVAIASGGLDSTVMIYALRERGDTLHLLTFDYGQRHRKEIIYAQKLAQRLGLPHEVVDISDVSRLLSSALTRGDLDVPKGPYREDTMSLTVVPNRNALFLSIASGFAISIGYDAVALAVHRGDHPVYPDCRPEFVRAYETMVRIATDTPLRILAPFVQMTKEEIVALGARLGVPFEETWSCYQGRAQHCGVCPTCIERRQAFQRAGVQDPTVYEAVYKEEGNVSNRQSL